MDPCNFLMDHLSSELFDLCGSACSNVFCSWPGKTILSINRLPWWWLITPSFLSVFLFLVFFFTWLPGSYAVIMHSWDMDSWPAGRYTFHLWSCQCWLCLIFTIMQEEEDNCCSAVIVLMNQWRHHFVCILHTWWSTLKGNWVDSVISFLNSWQLLVLVFGEWCQLLQFSV